MIDVVNDQPADETPRDCCAICGRPHVETVPCKSEDHAFRRKRRAVIIGRALMCAVAGYLSSMYPWLLGLVIVYVSIEAGRALWRMSPGMCAVCQVFTSQGFDTPPVQRRWWSWNVPPRFSVYACDEHFEMLVVAQHLVNELGPGDERIGDNSA